MKIVRTDRETSFDCRTLRLSERETINWINAYRERRRRWCAVIAWLRGLR